MGPLVVPFGGGRNSTGLLIGMLERGIRPDLILFADTGKGDAEKPETYEHIHKVNAWLDRNDYPQVTWVHKTSQYETLEDECLKKGTLPSLAFGWRTCSDKWKQEPQRKYINNWQPARDAWSRGEKVRRAVGFHAGEAHRAARFTEDEKYVNTYPLIEWGWSNDDCISALLRNGFVIPPKSACFFCPASTRAEVMALRADHPELYERALLMERNAAEMLVTVKGLGRRWSWQELENAPEVPCVEQICMCFDE